MHDPLTRLRLLRAGMILGMGSAIATAAGASETINYSYDPRGRLIQATHSGTVNNGVRSCYSLDKADNRLTQTVSSTCTGGGSGNAGVSFSISSNGAVTEGANSLFTITKSGTASGAVSVNYATANGTAAAGSDYSATSGTLTFATTDTALTVSVPTVDDTVVESPETFSMSLSSPTGGAILASPSSATATINDNDANANNPPTAVNDSGSQAVCTTGDYNVTANDSDPEGDYPLSVTSVSGVGFSVIAGDPTSVEFTSTSRTGNKVGTYTVQDSRGAASSATLTVNVTAGTCQ